MDHESSETMAAETIEWPFLKAQRDGGDPEVSTAAASDGDSTRPSSEGPSNNGGHYEIVVSDSSAPSTFTSSDGGGHQFETCLISNADLAALATANGLDPSSVKIEANDGRIQYTSTSDAVQAYFDSEPSLASAVDTDEQQRLIKVYQSAIDNSDNKLITVYEIKHEDDGGVGSGAAAGLVGGAGGTIAGLHSLDGGHAGAGDGRDVMVEIVHSPEDEQLLRSVAEDGTLSLPASIAGSSFPSQLATLSPQLTAAPTTVAELRCTLCGFVSFTRDEIAEHCMNAHDLFLCQTCNLVFKRRQSLQAHARAKHGQSAPQLPGAASIVTSSASTSRGGGGRNRGRVTKKAAKVVTSPTSMRTMTSTAGSNSNSGSNILMMPEIKDILAKNKAVLPVLPNSSVQQHQQQQQQQNQPHHQHSSSFGMASPGVHLATSASGGTKRASGGGGGGSASKRGGKRSSAHDWARVGSITAQQQQQLMMESRLSDPQTRLQFNTEFAKKITSHGIGAEVLGLSEERLPSKKGTFRLDIKEKVLENGETVPLGSTVKRHSESNSTGSGSGSGSGGDQRPENVDVFYHYDIVDTKVPAPDGGCAVICGLCDFSNPRIENVLFHCEIDHKQYYCQNKTCQDGFSSWDSLHRHMKTVHKNKDK